MTPLRDGDERHEKAIIVAAFPATGKSYMASRTPGVADSDSSRFSWIYPGTRERHPDWPSNYLDHLSQLRLSSLRFIFVSTHAEVRDALVKRGIDFMLVYPYPTLRDEYRERMQRRGSPPALIAKVIDELWDAALAECRAQRGCRHVQLDGGEYLFDALSEQGVELVERPTKPCGDCGEKGELRLLDPKVDEEDAWYPCPRCNGKGHRAFVMVDDKHSVQRDVEDFHRQVVGIPDSDTPAIRRPELRAELIREEAQETVDAIQRGDLVAAIDGMCDILAVTYGTAAEFGINLAPFWDEVHRTNMAKTDGPAREDGKRLKPEGWEPPDIAGILRRFAPEEQR